MTRVAILGVGAMGSRLAQNLLKTNHTVVVFSRTATKAAHLVEQGAIYAATPRTAAAEAEVVISMVTDDLASHAVWLTPETGAIASLQPGAIAIESSTLTVAWTRELAAAIEFHGASFLDAPVVGSRPQADSGKLIYLVGGNGEVLTQAKTTLQAAGAGAIHHLGETGQGMAMKLAVNALFAIQVVALAEILNALEQQGLTRANALACLGQLPVMSPAAQLAGGLMLAENHAPLFPIALVEKDLRYAVATAKTVGASLPVSANVRDIFQAAIAMGYGNDNITGVMQLFLQTAPSGIRSDDM